MMICVINDLFISLIWSVSGIERKSNIVINPLGAIKSKGFTGALNISKTISLIKNIPAVMQRAKTMVDEFNKFDVSNKNPNKIKKEARIRNANSVVISRNFSTSLLKFTG